MIGVIEEGPVKPAEDHEIDGGDSRMLETHLDGALEPAEAEALGRRLAREPELAAELGRLRAERAVRVAAWSSYEPAEAHAREAASRAVAAALREDRVRRATRLGRRATAAAAIIVLAFAGGWVARGRVFRQTALPARVVHDEHRFESSGAGDGASFPATAPSSAPSSR